MLLVHQDRVPPDDPGSLQALDAGLGLRCAQAQQHAHLFGRPAGVLRQKLQQIEIDLIHRHSLSRFDILYTIIADLVRLSTKSGGRLIPRLSLFPSGGRLVTASSSSRTSARRARR